MANELDPRLVMSGYSPDFIHWRLEVLPEPEQSLVRAHLDGDDLVEVREAFGLDSAEARALFDHGVEQLRIWLVG